MTDRKRIPLHDRVVVELLPVNFVGEQKTSGGIIIPIQGADSSSNLMNPVREARVLEVGPGELLYDGSIRALNVVPGDLVLVHENEVLPLKPVVDPNEAVIGIINERQILAVLHD